MAVTLRDIARHTGLSKPTVTRILGKDAHLFRAETRKRVIDAARELGYRPNAAARAVGSGRFGCIALVLGTSGAQSMVPGPLVHGLQAELAANDMYLAVSRLPDEQLSQSGFIPKVLRQSLCDGMLINYTHNIPPAMLELIRTHDAPAIWINARLTSDCVHFDDLGAARGITERLLALGHRRIAYVAFAWVGDRADRHYSELDRAAGYAAAMGAAGLPARVHDDRRAADEQLAWALHVLRAADRPTAILTYNEATATTFYLAAATLGLSVPGDLSLATFPLTAPVIAGRPWSGAAVPAMVEGQEAVRAILRKIERPAEVLAPVVVPLTPVVGGATTAPPQP